MSTDNSRKNLLCTHIPTETYKSYLFTQEPTYMEKSHEPLQFSFLELDENFGADFLAQVQAILDGTIKVMAISVTARSAKLNVLDLQYLKKQITFAEWCDGFDKLCDDEMKGSGK